MRSRCPATLFHFVLLCQVLTAPICRRPTPCTLHKLKLRQTCLPSVKASATPLERSNGLCCSQPTRSLHPRISQQSPPCHPHLMCITQQTRILHDRSDSCTNKPCSTLQMVHSANKLVHLARRSLLIHTCVTLVLRDNSHTWHQPHDQSNVSLLWE